MNANQELLKHFIQTHIPFFTKEVPFAEEEFMTRYKSATSEWWDIRKSIQHYPLNSHSIDQLDRLFEEAEVYFYQVLGHVGGYSRANFDTDLKTKWSEIQKIAVSFLNKNG